MRRLPLLLGCTLLAIACSDLGLDIRSLTELERAAARWERNGPDSYDYAIQWICFCLDEHTRPVRVRVVAGEVVERTWVETGDPVSEPQAQAFTPVEGLFELLREAYRDEAQVEVTYDSDLGYPTLISIDYDEMLADDEISVVLVDPPVALP